MLAEGKSSVFMTGGTLPSGFTKRIATAVGQLSQLVTYFVMTEGYRLLGEGIVVLLTKRR